jgi:wyosine [tRNA(Phe)-imidazoG37] synthetase (radical SAM superfamily)
MEVTSLTQYKLYAKCIPSGECLTCPVGGKSITYGPFTSRRRGVSIGINLFPLVKVCSFNCIYCFRGSTSILTAEPVDDGSGITSGLLVKALEVAVEEVAKGFGGVRAIDFSGRGEPTLHPRFREFLDTVKAFAKSRGLSTSIGVFTNSSTLHRESIAIALEKADYVEAKLDTVLHHKFTAINAPHKAISIDAVVEGLRSFRKRFGGTLVVQTMLLSYRNLNNYGAEDAEALAERLAAVEPDEVHLYTVYRIPRTQGVEKACKEAMESFAKVLKSYGLRVEVYT